MRGVAFKGEFRRKGLCFARAVVHFCCHFFCVIPPLESFLGERLAHRDAASNSFRYGLSALALDVEKSSHGADSCRTGETLRGQPSRASHMCEKNGVAENIGCKANRKSARAHKPPTPQKRCSPEDGRRVRVSFPPLCGGPNLDSATTNKEYLKCSERRIVSLQLLSMLERLWLSESI